MSELLTSTEAARLLGVHRDTTRRAAASGHVQEARREPRAGAINPPWVAPRESWEQWYALQQTAGRPRQEREEGSGMILADRIELAERLCAERGYTVRMTVQPHHGQPRYSGPPRPYMADGRWALYAVHAATGRMVSLGDRSRPPTERRIARQLDRLDRLVAAARAVETSEAPTST